MDTLDWVSVTGTFVATGNEKYALIGIFSANGNVDTVLVNPAWGPGCFTDGCIDDVSCIDIDLKAFAGRDTFFIPGDSIYLGRPSDVGIDEDCMWYKLPNTTNAVDTAAGFWLKPTTTCTYVVKQEICGVVKWDTIVLYQSAIGINELNNNSVFKISPNPTSDILNIEILNKEFLKENSEIEISNYIGQTVLKTKFKKELDVSELSNGVYILQIKNPQNQIAVKRLVIAK